MFKRIVFLLGLTVAGAANTQIDQTDFKIRTITRSRTTGLLREMPGIDHEETTYIKGDRIRHEFRAFLEQSPSDPNARPPLIATIMNCRTGKVFTLDLDARTYSVGRVPKYPSREELQRRGATARKVERDTRPPDVRIEVETQDTGEKRDFFGHEAMKFVISRKTIPLSNDVVFHASEETTESWYVNDIRQPNNSCAPDYFRSGTQSVLMPSVSKDGRSPNLEFHSQGVQPTGYLIESHTQQRQQMDMPDGRPHQIESKSEYKVVEYDTAALDPALFEVPKGYKKVRVPSYRR